MQRCKCADFWSEAGEKWYPRRLLDLEELRTDKDPDLARVRLVESEIIRPNERYITLSHCWGKQKPGKEPLKLTFTTEKRLKDEGVGLQELPQTFRDAVVFASRLEDVRYIWIDSLCIRQPILGPEYNRADQLQDWLEQSRHMGTVYRKAFLNISATASSDSAGGLFFGHRPEHLWDNEVDVNCPSEIRKPEMEIAIRELVGPTRCTVIDVSAWEDLVDQAPINQRGWVLQERLLAPRVLHFCHNQISWECSEFQEAEGHPEMYSTTRLKDGYLVEERPSKSLTADSARLLREARLRGVSDDDKYMKHLYIFELWKRIVETYTQTQLTNPDDILIALAGIARQFSEGMFFTNSQSGYVAGLWSQNLESQLLWYVNDAYVDGNFVNPAKRHAERAPSFSWASIDTEYGVTYADVTDYGAARLEELRRSSTEMRGEDSDPSEELLIKITGHHITLVDIENPFGMIKKGQLLIKPRYLQRIELHKLPESRRVPFSWTMKNAADSRRPREISNINLDAPNSDKDIFEDDAELYCMPTAFGPRTEQRANRHLYCLLLKYQGPVNFPISGSESKEGQYREFKRIGITKLFPTDTRGLKALRKEEIAEVICLS